MIQRQTSSDGIDLSLHFGQINARFGPPHHHGTPVSAILDGGQGQATEWQIDLGGQETRQVWRHHPDYGVMFPVEFHALSDQVPAPVKAIPPKLVAKNDYTFAASAVFLGRKGTAESRLNSQESECICRNV